MRVRWYGQSAFALVGGDNTVFIDPFGDMAPAPARGMTWTYPAIAGATADVLLVTHEHGDHNAVEVIGALELDGFACSRDHQPLGSPHSK